MLDRIKNLKKEILSQNLKICVERARYLTESYKENENKSTYIKRAKALEKILKNMTIYINDKELIVGNLSSHIKSAPIFPEYSVKWIKELVNNKDLNKRSKNRFSLDENNIEELLEILRYWEGKNLNDKCNLSIFKELKIATNDKVLYGEELMVSGSSNIIPDFKKALTLGLEGINNEVTRKIKSLDDNKNNIKKKEFLQSILIVNKSIINFSKRYKDLALKLLEEENNIERKKELLKISKICNRVPRKPPTNFYEDIQMIWFIYLVLEIESNGDSLCFGRMDQYLYKYYKNDIHNKTLSKYKAKELLQCFVIKLNSIIKIRPNKCITSNIGYLPFSNITIGGKSYFKDNCVNELSYLILESIGELNLIEPNLSIRVNLNYDENFIKESVKTIKNGFKSLGFYNDEEVINFLVNSGVKYEDAYNYGITGYGGISIPGKHGYNCIGKTIINMPKIMEITLNKFCNGKEELNEVYTYKSLYNTWRENLKYYTNLVINLDDIIDNNIKDFPNIFCSSLVNNCIERGKPINEGGEFYNIVSGAQIGLTNVANSFKAIKETVYENNILTINDIKKAVDKNFKGKEEKNIKDILSSASKYGNNEKYVDDLMGDIYLSYLNEIKKYKHYNYKNNFKKYNYSLSTVGLCSHVILGKHTYGTPDGRKAYMPISEGILPYYNTDIRGPKNLLKSLSTVKGKLEFNQSLNLKFSKNILETAYGIKKIINLIKYFINTKSINIEFNILDNDILKEAQKYPQKYKDLVVKVEGCCAKFVNLDYDIQESIINKTEQYF